MIRTLAGPEAFWLYDLSKFWSRGYVHERTRGGDGTHLENPEDVSIRWTNWIMAREPVLPEMKLFQRKISPGG